MVSEKAEISIDEITNGEYFFNYLNALVQRLKERKIDVLQRNIWDYDRRKADTSENELGLFDILGRNITGENFDSTILYAAYLLGMRNKAVWEAYDSSWEQKYDLARRDHVKFTPSSLLDSLVGQVGGFTPIGEALIRSVHQQMNEYAQAANFGNTITQFSLETSEYGYSCKVSGKDNISIPSQAIPSKDNEMYAEFISALKGLTGNEAVMHRILEGLFLLNCAADINPKSTVLYIRDTSTQEYKDKTPFEAYVERNFQETFAEYCPAVHWYDLPTATATKRLETGVSEARFFYIGTQSKARYLSAETGEGVKVFEKLGFIPDYIIKFETDSKECPDEFTPASLAKKFIEGIAKLPEGYQVYISTNGASPIPVNPLDF